MSKTTKNKNRALWVLVTNGKCDGGDPEFEYPSPDIYASQKGALTAMKNDVDYLMTSYGWTDGRMAQLDRMEKELMEDGATGIDLNDCTRIEYSLWRCSVMRGVKPTYPLMTNFVKE